MLNFFKKQDKNNNKDSNNVNKDINNSENQNTKLINAPSTSKKQETASKKGFFSSLKRGLGKTREILNTDIVELVAHTKKIDDDLLEEIESQLLMADVGIESTLKIIHNLTERLSKKELNNADTLFKALEENMDGILSQVSQPLKIDNNKAPFVILMVGINGAGKTTTIGKLAKQYQQQGFSVMLAAGDTFRAAAVEQLQVWGERNNIPVIAQQSGADSASVIYDAIEAAGARGIDILIADTAGRLHTQTNLMDELSKVARVAGKLDASAPHEVMLVLDAGTGQNAINQAENFLKTVAVSGITLTKLDGTAKGGIIFALADKLHIPIRYIGVGEGIDDLREFNSIDFVRALLSR